MTGTAFHPFCSSLWVRKHTSPAHTHRESITRRSEHWESCMPALSVIGLQQNGHRSCLPEQSLLLRKQRDTDFKLGTNKEKRSGRKTKLLEVVDEKRLRWSQRIWSHIFLTLLRQKKNPCFYSYLPSNNSDKLISYRNDQGKYPKFYSKSL